MLGIDVLERMGFEPLKGKRVGLLTNPAGVNRFGTSTIDVLRRAQGVNLTALFGPEHGIYGDEKAEVPVLDKIDRRTGLPVFSLYGKHRKPTAQMLNKIDVLVVDLQDVGARSYTYTSCMLLAMSACFEAGKEVVILDRPNPLGGLKVDGPMLDMEFKSYVGMFPAPYVHGLTIGEIAAMAKGSEGWLAIPEKVRKSGRLCIIKMSGWRRDMLWGDTGLKWVATSPAIPTSAAAFGYSMTGLGAQIGDFQHGYGSNYPFRFLTYKGKSAREICQRLKACSIRGLDFKVAKNNLGQEGVYVYITDFELLRPTELSFYMMKLACEFSRQNPFARASESNALLYNKHVGSKQWWFEISRKGANANVGAFMAKWAAEAKNFQEKSRNFWLYK
ncbi:MAG: DUF1343 domain-containing protein [Opitutales bacterium]|nr:DUF1343 domain-containing protein [Opitutales bacterium]